MMQPSPNTKRPSATKKQRVRDFAAARAWSLIGEQEWKELKALPNVSETTIRASGLLIAPPWSGVAQHTLDDLDTSLRQFSDVYTSQPDLRRYCRDQVIAAKARARFASLSGKVDESKRRLKAEMLVWLGDPALFPAWVSIRRKRIGDATSSRVPLTASQSRRF
jgi:hypothetical protein